MSGNMRCGDEGIAPRARGEPAVLEAVGPGVPRAASRPRRTGR